AWETQGQVLWADLSRGLSEMLPTAVPGEGKGRKHPALAANPQGQTLVAWTEGTGWNKGGSVAGQAYDAKNHPIETGSGRAEGLPAWGAPAVFARADGTFVVVY